MNMGPVGAFQDFLDHLTEEMTALSVPHRIAFSASCCQRTLPNYRLFFEKNHWGDPHPLEEVLDSTWSFLKKGSPSLEYIAALRSACMNVVPHSDDFGSPVATAGQEASFMIVVLTELCADGMPKHATRIATFARDTIDRFVIITRHLDPKEPGFEQRIGDDPTMLAEFHRQESDLRSLKGQSSLSPDFIGHFQSAVSRHSFPRFI